MEVALHEALSGIFGSVSLAAWVFLSLLLNYQSGNADGISLAFLMVWMTGDIANLAGAIWADLVPMVIVLAVYYCFQDTALISQKLYYTLKSPPTGEDEPLLGRTRTNDSTGLPGSMRRHSTTEEQVKVEAPPRIVLKNMMSVLGVFVIGTLGWLACWQVGIWKPSVEGDTTEAAVGAQILGYISAVCYLCARIPQIIKNHQEKSCEGLSLLFFMLSVTGNLTYGLGILCHSLERDYVLKNLPWLLGSMGTMIEDGIIFLQFRMYTQ